MKKMHTGFCALTVAAAAGATLCGPALLDTNVHAAPAPKAQKATAKSVLLSVSGMH
jgi:hypothetical protein